MEIQLKKGILELCILSLLAEKDYYVYDLIKEIRNYIDMTAGAVYPLVKRMEHYEYVISYCGESKEGPLRKYYQLTQNGFDRYYLLKEEWRKLCINIDKLLDRNEEKII